MKGASRRPARRARMHRSGIYLVVAIFVLGGFFYLLLVLSNLWMERP